MVWYDKMLHGMQKIRLHWQVYGKLCGFVSFNVNVKVGQLYIARYSRESQISYFCLQADKKNYSPSPSVKQTEKTRVGTLNKIAILT